MKVINLYNENNNVLAEGEIAKKIKIRDVDESEVIAKIEAGEYGEYTSYKVVTDNIFRTFEEKELDKSTYRKIKIDCERILGKPEEYFLRKGILDKTDEEFLAYLQLVNNNISDMVIVKQVKKLKD